ncbi:hypothetical protein NX059_001650 [Plenodomus lindquistii]|nr:hypothetical protein NX059_001650 [Plenodomus lindquistii]
MDRATNYDDSNLPPDVARMRQERKDKAKQIEKARNNEQAQHTFALFREARVSMVRKRVNSELLGKLQRPAKPNAPKSIKGIGLYTHVKGTKPRCPHETSVEPVFLSIGGPNLVFRKGTRDCALDEDVAKLWNEVQSNVQKEDAFCQEAVLGSEDLKNRYGALDVPVFTAQPQVEPTAPIQLQQRDVELQEDIDFQARRNSFGYMGAARGARRPSWGREASQQRREEREHEDRGRLSRRDSGTTVAAANTYEASRDPRLSRR